LTSSGDLPEIEVNEAMIAAGVSELREHSIWDDVRYLVACIYREMEYTRRGL
jgi:hypothetical protein